MTEPSQRSTDPAPGASTPSSLTEPESNGPPQDSAPVGSRNLIIWGLLSVALIGLVTFGWMNIRYWENYYVDDEYIGSTMLNEPERILTVWSTQVSNLPSLGSELISQILFVGSALLFLLGTVVALWILLIPGAQPTDPPISPSNTERS